MSHRERWRGRGKEVADPGLSGGRAPLLGAFLLLVGHLFFGSFCFFLAPRKSLCRRKSLESRGVGEAMSHLMGTEYGDRAVRRFHVVLSFFNIVKIGGVTLG
jgi:hypothetical protein